jgi:hypothetical protein
MPVLRGLITVIISPLSNTCNLWCAAWRYTSYLFWYSVRESEILHFISPLCLRIPSYSWRLETFDGHSITIRDSPDGAATLVQFVINAPSDPKCFCKAVFHSSLSPLYTLVCLSLVTWLYIYNQHALSALVLGIVVRGLAGFHTSLLFVVYAAAFGSAGVFVASGLDYAAFFACSIYLAACLVYIGRLKITCLSRISSSVSMASSVVRSTYVCWLGGGGSICSDF